MLASWLMGQWLYERESTIYVVAENGKRYAFQPRKTDRNSGYILVKDKFGKQRSVTGNNEEGKFITNPYCRNALAILTIEELDKARGLAQLYKDIPANELGPPKRASKDYSVAEIQAMTEDEMAEYVRLVESELS